MAGTVKLRDVVDHLEMLSDESAAYLNKRTGELHLLTQEQLFELADEDEDDEDDHNLDDDPEWLKEAKLKAREVTSSDDWLELPSKFDIHDYSIMEEFCRTIEDEEISGRLLQQIRGSGAFRRFRDALADIGLEQAWFQFRSSALERIAIEWLEENEIAYSRDPISDEAVN